MMRARQLTVAVAFALAFALVPATALGGKPDKAPAPSAQAGVATVETEVTTGGTMSAPQEVSAASRDGATVAPDAVAGVDGVDAALAGGCWWAQVKRYAKNLIGSTLWAYFQKINWCSNGSYITSHSRTRWGETYWPGWSWEGNIGSTTGGGNGSTYYRSWTQGHFCLISYFSCVQNAYPWIDMTVYRNGTYSWSAGG